MEAQGPEGADFRGPIGHRTVHGDHRAYGRTGAEDDGDKQSKDADELCHHLGLFLEKPLFSLGREVLQAIVRLKRCLHG